MATLADLTNRTYDILTISRDGIPSLLLEYVQGLCNEFEFMMTKGMKFPFLRKRNLFRTIDDTNLSAAITTVSASITVPTGTISSDNAYIQIDEDVIKYTGVTTGATTDTLTGVTGISVSHSAGDRVKQLYAVPTDYSHQSRLSINKVNHEFVENIMDVESRFIGRRFGFIQTDDGELMQIEPSQDDEIAYFNYFQEGGAMSSSTDTSIIPDLWAKQLIPQAVAGAIKKYKHMERRGEFLMTEAEKAKQLMRRHYGTRNNDQKPGITFGRYGSRKNY